MNNIKFKYCWQHRPKLTTIPIDVLRHIASIHPGGAPGASKYFDDTMSLRAAENHEPMMNTYRKMISSKRHKLGRDVKTPGRVLAILGDFKDDRKNRPVRGREPIYS